MNTSGRRRATRNAVSRYLIPFALVLALALSPGCDNFLGLQDWQRDLLSLAPTPGLLALALLTGPGPAGPAGPTGPQGLPGEDGLFHVSVEDYFTHTDATSGFVGPTGDFIPDVVGITEPVLGEDNGGTPGAPAANADRVAFRVLIPPSYEGVNPVTLRLAFRRSGPTPGGEDFAFDIFVRRLVDGANTPENYINPPVRTVSVTPPVAGNDDEFQILDLPINVAVPNGLGGAALAAGDFLAVELVTVGDDSGQYLLLSVEFYETTAAPPVSGGTIS
ncbi:MAG: hypothetical protein ABII12_08425 [Planctomycetota bacterium]